MLQDEIIEKAIKEIETPALAVTKQFLEIHQVIYAEGRPKPARVDMEKANGTAIVYFAVVEQKFYLAVYVDTIPAVEVRWVNTEPYNSVCFRASSKNLSLQQLSEMTILQPSGGRNKGDRIRKEGGTGIVWKESTIFFEPNPEPDEFEDKLKKLIAYLYTDREGVTRFVNEAGGYIQVAIDFHNGNTMLGGPHIDKESLKRMAALNLEIDFDLYASGEGFK